MTEPSAFYKFVEPFVPKPLRPLVLKYQELLAYCVCGGTATLINFAVFYGLTLGFNVNYLAANIAAWVLSVTFAFIGNKTFVFEDARWDAKTALKQAGEFVAARLFSLGLEELILYFFVARLGCDQNIVKFFALAAVTISNYIFAKLLIFKKKR